MAVPPVPDPIWKLLQATVPSPVNVSLTFAVVRLLMIKLPLMVSVALLMVRLLVIPVKVSDASALAGVLANKGGLVVTGIDTLSPAFCPG